MKLSKIIKLALLSTVFSTILSTKLSTNNISTINVSANSINKSSNSKQSENKLFKQVKKDMLKMINQERSEKNIKPMKFNHRLNVTANWRVKKIAQSNQHKVINHLTPLMNLSENYTKYNLIGINGNKKVIRIALGNMFNDGIVTNKRMQRNFLNSKNSAIGISIYKASKYIYYADFITATSTQLLLK